jgi:hypothetical protein
MSQNIGQASSKLCFTYVFIPNSIFLLFYFEIEVSNRPLNFDQDQTSLHFDMKYPQNYFNFPWFSVLTPDQTCFLTEKWHDLVTQS